MRAAGTDALHVTLAAKLAYEERSDTLTCEVGGMFKQDGSDWFVGELASQEVAGARARLRLQGNTLRIVHADEADHRVCGDLASITGSYFPMVPGAPGTAAAAAARTVQPTFRCGTAQNADEEEICADPELLPHATPRSPASMRRPCAGWNRGLPRAAARRLLSALFVKRQSDRIRKASLHPAAAKGTLHAASHRRCVREELKASPSTSAFAMLANLDEKRKGIAGLWEAYNAALTVVPADDKTDGTATAQGFKWETGDYKSRCDFRSAGRIERGVFKAADAIPHPHP